MWADTIWIILGAISTLAMAGWVISVYKDERPSPVVINGVSGKLLSETDAGKLGASIMNGRCPDCGSGEGFYRGPQGCASINIFCANPQCETGFNYTNMFGEGHAERIGKRVRTHE